HRLAVALHVLLLEVGGEAAEPLVVRQHRVGRKAPGVAIPDTEQAHDDRQVLLEFRLEEVLVHLVGAGEERLEIVEADRNRHWQADGRPDRITAADQSQKPKMRSWRMPKASHAARLVETAAKWSLTALSPSASAIHFRAELALVMVSSV